MANDERIAIYEDGPNHIELEKDTARQTYWGTYAQVAAFFGCSEDNISQHLKKMYASGELDESRTSEKSSEVRQEGTRSVTRQFRRINLDAIIELGYKVNSPNAMKFRQWATSAIRELILEGVVVDEQRLAANPEAQRRLALYLRSLRTGEKEMYQKVRDVFKASASDYDGGSKAAQRFYSMVQDKFHFAATQRTAAQIVIERADGSQSNMGLTTFKGEHPTFEDAKVGKNYLTEDELQVLENLCEQFLLFAESKAFRGQTMTMEELQFKLNTLLAANDYPILYEYGSFKRGDADAHAKKQLAIYNNRLRAGAAPKQIGSR
jgi:hypothetical protein